MVEKLVTDPFLKNQNWAYLWINSLKFYTVCFSLHVQLEDNKNILKLWCWPLAFPWNKAFFKNQKRSWTSLPALYSVWFLKKNVFHVIFYKLTKFHCLIVFTSWDIGQYLHYNYLFSSLQPTKPVIDFEISLTHYFITPFAYMPKNSRQILKYHKNE